MSQVVVVDESATDRGKRTIATLVAEASRHSLEAQTEYPVPGGRIDVVWLWKSEAFQDALPVVAFEVESSWRTRKHIKGDYLNLLDLQPALGVIVLLGDGPEVESTRSFAREMVSRRPGRTLIWTESDVAAMGRVRLDANERLPPPPPGADEERGLAGAKRHGKYAALTTWLLNETRTAIPISFAEIEELMGFPLPASARKHGAYWRGGQLGSTAGNAIRDAGWKATDVKLDVGRLVLIKRTETPNR